MPSPNNNYLFFIEFKSFHFFYKTSLENVFTSHFALIIKIMFIKMIHFVNNSEPKIANVKFTLISKCITHPKSFFTIDLYFV